MKKILLLSTALLAASASAQDGKRTVLKDSLNSITITTQELGSVDVVVKIQKTKMNGDVLVTRIVGSPLANAGTAEDALAHVPGLLRRNGQIEVIGKGTPIYYINGRRVQDPSELLRLSSQEIKEVEVINTPGAQYDAQTNAVVRIKTVKRMDKGLGGSFDANDYYSPSHGDNRLSSTLNLNYRYQSLALFGGLTFDDYMLKGYETDFGQTSIIGGNIYEQMGQTHLSQHYRNLKFNLGAEYTINENHSFGFRIDRSDNLLGRGDYSMSDYIRYNAKQIDLLQSDTHNDVNGIDSWAADGYYIGQVGKLNIDWNVDYYKTTHSDHALTHESDFAGQTNVDAFGADRNQLFATKLVFSYPIGLGKLQAGTEIDWLKRDNEYTINQQSINDDFSEVKENTYAAFVEYGTMIPRAGMLNVGLRYEHVDFDYISKIDASQNLSRTSDNLYPTFSFATQYKEMQASLSYSVKTRRPDFRTLRSNIEYNNRYTLSTGNPKLKNEIKHQASLNMRWRYLSGSLNYQCQENGIYDWTNQYDQEGVVMINWVNFDKPIHQVSGFVNFTNTIGRWTPSYTVGMQKQWLSFDLEDSREASGTRTVSYNKPMFIFTANNAYKIPSRRDDGFGAWLLELNSEFLSNFHYGNAEITNCFWNLQFSVQKSWLENDALSVKLAVNDIAHMAHHDAKIDLGNYVMTQSPINGVSRSLYDPQTISLSLRYKFNATKRKYKGNGAGEDVRSRM